MTHTVSEVARLSGVTIRTLHHYDEVGVLCPQQRSRSGYRLYGDGDLERLQEILFFKELGLGLTEIRQLLEEDRDRRHVLEQQRSSLAAQAERFARMVDAVDRALAAFEGGFRMNKEDMFEVFGEFDPSEHEEEVKERWGETDAYAMSQRRTKDYGKEDWLAIKAEGHEINETFARLLAEGADPSASEAMDAAEQHRGHVTKWFYTCSPEIHAGLGQMYTQDPRFTKYWEDISPGLTAFVADAFTANALRQGP